MRAQFPAHLFSYQRFPAQVFSRPSGLFLFFEFARAFGEGAWRLFARLGRQFGEPCVWCLSIEPDSKTYYQTNFGEEAAFSFASSALPECYTARMHDWPPTSVADAIAYRADVVAWGGGSDKWACWGERASGLCVLNLPGDDRLRKELALFSDDYLPLLTLDEALNNVASSEMTSEEFRKFARSMHSSYAPKI